MYMRCIDDDAFKQQQQQKQKQQQASLNASDDIVNIFVVSSSSSSSITRINAVVQIHIDDSGLELDCIQRSQSSEHSRGFEFLSRSSSDPSAHHALATQRNYEPMNTAVTSLMIGPNCFLIQFPFAVAKEARFLLNLQLDIEGQMEENLSCHVHLFPGDNKMAFLLLDGISKDECYTSILESSYWFIGQPGSQLFDPRDLLHNYRKHVQIGRSLYGNKQNIPWVQSFSSSSPSSSSSLQTRLFFLSVIGDYLSERPVNSATTFLQLFRNWELETQEEEQLRDWLILRSKSTKLWWDCGYEKVYAAIRCALEHVVNALMSLDVPNYCYLQNWHLLNMFGLIWKTIVVVQSKKKGIEEDDEDDEDDQKASSKRQVMRPFGTLVLAPPWQSLIARDVAQSCVVLRQLSREASRLSTDAPKTRTSRTAMFLTAHKLLNSSVEAIIHHMVTDALPKKAALKGKLTFDTAATARDQENGLFNEEIPRARACITMLEDAISQLEFCVPREGRCSGTRDTKPVLETSPLFSLHPQDYTISHLAGTGTRGFKDGVCAELGGPYDILELGPGGDLLFTEVNSSSIRLLESGRSNQNVVTLVGTVGSGYRDGPVNKARVLRPRGLFRSRDGSILIADSGNHRIRRLTADLRLLKTVAGSGQEGFDDGDVQSATFAFPTAVAELSNGNILVADKNNGAVRMICKATRTVSTVAHMSLPISLFIEDEKNVLVGQAEGNEGEAAAINRLSMNADHFEQSTVCSSSPALSSPSAIVKVKTKANTDLFLIADKGLNCILMLQKGSSPVKLLGSFAGISSLCVRENDGSIVVTEVNGHRIRVIHQIRDSFVAAKETFARMLSSTFCRKWFLSEIKRMDVAVALTTTAAEECKIAIRNMAQAAETTLSLWEEVRRQACTSEYEEHLLQCSPKVILQNLPAFVAACPRLKSLHAVVSKAVSPENLGEVFEHVVAAVSKYSWPQTPKDQALDCLNIQSIASTFRLTKNQRVCLMGIVLRHPTFTLGVCAETIGFVAEFAEKDVLHNPFMATWRTTDHVLTRGSILTWLNRVYSSECFERWSLDLSSLGMGKCDSVVESLVRIHLSALAGFDTTSSSAVGLSAIDMLLNCAKHHCCKIVQNVVVEICCKMLVKIKDFPLFGQEIAVLTGFLRSFSTYSPVQKQMLLSVATSALELSSTPPSLESFFNPSFIELWSVSIQIFMTCDPVAPDGFKRLVFEMLQELKQVVNGIDDCPIKYATIIRDREELLKPVFEVFGACNVVQNATRTTEMASKLHTILEEVKQMGSMLFPGNELYSWILLTSNRWAELSTHDIQWFLSLPTKEKPCSIDSELAPLPSNLVLSRNWIRCNLASELFKEIWRQNASIISNQTLMEVEVQWRSLYRQIADRSISCSVLLELPPIKESDLIAMSSTAAAEETNSDPWATFEPDPQMIAAALNALRCFEKAKTLSSEKGKNFSVTISLIRPLMHSESGTSSVDAILQAATAVQKALSEGWNRLSLSSLAGLEALEKVDTELLNLDHRLLKALSASAELLDWLRNGFGDDADFSTSVEIAMGCNEGTCPAELWVDGRLNEVVISQLVRIRKELYPYIFRSEECLDQILPLVTAISQISTQEFQEEVLHECNQHRLALMELLTTDSSASFCTRLAQIFDPRFDATWWCNGQCSYYLEYTQSEKKKQCLGESELLDLQTTSVLSQKYVVGTSTEYSALFSAQISLFMQMAAKLKILKKMGHPCFGDQFSLSIKAVDSIENFQALANALHERVEKWKEIVSEMRSVHPALNLFSLQKMLLHTEPSPSSRSSQSWLVDADSVGAVLLERLGSRLDEEFKDAIPKPRVIELNHSKSMLEGTDSTTATVLVASGGATTMAYVLSVCGWSGLLPESDTFLSCPRRCRFSDSFEEELDNFMRRWSQSAFFHRSGTPYMICDADLLPTDLQNQIVNKVLHLRSTSPLFLLVSNGNCVLATALGHLIKSGDLLANEELLKVGAVIGERVTVYSGLAGCGKSFAIKARSSNKHYLHFPINKIMTPEDIHHRLAPLLSSIRDEGVVLHLDFADTTGNVVENYDWISSLVLTGLFAPNLLAHDKFSIAIEISGTELPPVCTYLPIVNPQCSPESLVVPAEKSEMFYFVCGILDWHLHQSRSVGPKAMLPLADMKGKDDRCFELILEYFRRSKREQSMSYWTLWSYIGVCHTLFKRFVENIDVFAMSTRAQLQGAEMMLDTAAAIALPSADSISSNALMNLDIVGWGDEENSRFLLFPAKKGQRNFYICKNQSESMASLGEYLVHILRHNFEVIETDSITDPAVLLRILAAITQVDRSEAEFEDILLRESFCLTGDVITKIFAICVRLEARIPVLLMGECGCGKTMILSFLSRLLDTAFFVLNVHGGTTEEDIFGIFAQAEVAAIGSKVHVFLDEVNTCSHMGLLSEALCKRSLNGKPISDRIRLMAALNPYRKRKGDATGGLVFRFNDQTDPMASLVYKVHPLPCSLTAFVFDFASLSVPAETLYVRRMILARCPLMCSGDSEMIAQCILVAQRYLRRLYGKSSTSLRDVKRSMDLLIWFESNLLPSSELLRHGVVVSGVCIANLTLISTVLSIAHVYYYRLTDSERANFFQQIRWGVDFGTKNATPFWPELKKPGCGESILSQVQHIFCQNLFLEEGIAMNAALAENCFVVIICILNRIPVFLVGKPGTSKTLAFQVLMSNLQGEQSQCAFWTKFPGVHVVQYQCSPLSTAAAITRQYSVACAYQQHSPDIITILLLDEIGLAEHSPDMPLKCLHAMLVNPPVAIVGLSNWELDPAKMNRAVCLTRGDPSQQDAHLTALRIICPVSTTVAQTKSHSHPIEPYIENLASAFYQIMRDAAKESSFVGMRDYYSLIKQLWRIEDSSYGSLIRAVSRNFGGVDAHLQRALQRFAAACGFQDDIIDTSVQVPVRELIQENLQDIYCRHLMLISSGAAALPLLIGCGLVSTCEVNVLIGSSFRSDTSELHLVQQIQQVKTAMGKGSTIILLNQDQIYESLYDVLNQRYVTKRDHRTGKRTKMLRLAIGTRSQLCPVKDEFKIIVVVDKEDAQKRLDLPLLNRFEKQHLSAHQFLGIHQQLALSKLEQWVKLIAEECGYSPDNCFCGFDENSLASLILHITNFQDTVEDATVRQAQLCLARVAFPLAILQSESLGEIVGGVDRHLQRQGNLDAVLSNQIGQFCVILTHSPRHHLTTNAVSLSDVESEKRFTDLMLNYFNLNANNPNQTMVIQCDPLQSPQSLITHARYIATQEFAKVEKMRNSTPQCRMLFVIHLPPTVVGRCRYYPLGFWAPWQFVFVDDLRTSNNSMPLLLTLMQNSLYDMVQHGQLPVSKLVRERYVHALASSSSAGQFPEIQGEDSMKYTLPNRISHLRSLLCQPSFSSALEALVIDILSQHCSTVEANGLHIHVSKSGKSQAAGSLQQCLYASAIQCFVQVLAHCLKFWNCCNNLWTVRDADEMNAWLELAQEDRDQIVKSFSWDDLEVPGRQLYPVATVSFPFSWRFAPSLAKEQLDKLVVEVDLDYHRQLSGEIFGEKPFHVWVDKDSGEHLRYLKDLLWYLVGVSSFPNIKFDFQVRIAAVLSRITVHTHILRTMVGVHIALNRITSQLLQILDLMNNPMFCEEDISRTVSELESISMNSAEGALLLLNQHISTLMMWKLWEQVGQGNFSKNWRDAVLELSKGMFTLLLDSAENAELRTSWTRISIVRVMLDEYVSDRNEVLLAMVSDFKNLDCQGGCSLVLSVISDVVCKHIPDIQQVVLVNLLTRALDEVLMSMCSGSPEHLIAYLVSSLLHTASDAIVQKITMLCLIRVVSASSLPMPSEILKDAKMQGLYLSFVEDALLSKIEEDGFFPALLQQISTFDYTVKTEGIWNPSTSVMVEQTAAVRVAIRLYIDATNDTQKYPNDVMSWVRHCLAHPCGSAARKFAIQILQKTFGWPHLIDLCLEKDRVGFDWLYQYCIVPKEVQQQHEHDIDYKFTDGMRLLVEHYDAARRCVLDCLDGKGTEALDTLISSGMFKKVQRWSTEAAASSSSSQLPNSTIAVLAATSRYSISGKMNSSTLITWLKGNVMSTIPKRCRWIVDWILQGCQIEGLSRVTHSLQTEVIAHCCIWAVQHEDSLFHSVLFDVLSQLSSFMPTMPDDEITVVLKAMGEHLGWYTCPNGHPYTVDNCTRPMQTSVCVNCGAAIGGKDHVPVKGNSPVSLDKVASKNCKRGFLLEATRGDAANSVRRISGDIQWATVRSVRFFIKGLLLVGMTAGPVSLVHGTIALLFPSRERNVEKIEVIQSLADGLLEDWNVLKAKNCWNDHDLALMLQFVIPKMDMVPRTFTNVMERSKCEHALQEIIEATFGNGNLIRQFGESNSIKVAERIFHKKYLRCFLTQKSSQWRYRWCPTLAALSQQMAAFCNNQKKYPSLAAFLREEQRMQKISLVADILQWHNLLFKNLKPLTREEAGTITNEDFVSKFLSVEQRPAAEMLMHKFCHAFNSTLPMVKNLYECERNPFLNKVTGKVDLSASGTGHVAMSPSTPLSFSLPSIVPGETDAPGLCTIQIINELIRSHNEIVAYSQQQQQQQQDEHPTTTTTTTLACPVISFQTDKRILQRLLLQYSREEHLVPLISTFNDSERNTQQPFDLAMIDKGISRFVHGKSYLHLHIAHFSYLGELRKTGRLSILQKKIPQIDLAAPLVKGLKTEIDTQFQSSALLAALEDIIRLVTSSQESMDGGASIQSFACRTILNSEAEWEEIAGRTIATGARLKHLRSLFMELEEMTATATDRVAKQYDDGLELELKELVLKSKPLLNLGVLLPILRDFMVDQLAQPSWDASCNLKEYLSFYTEVDLDSMNWYETHFPKQLELRHTAAVYKMWME